MFTKFPSCITGPYGDIKLPPGGHTDWEVELVVIIGRRGRHVGAAAAWQHVAGWPSARTSPSGSCSWPATPPQFSLGKSLPGFGPVGPWLVTLGRVRRPQRPRTRLRDQRRAGAAGRTSELIFSVPALIEKLSAGHPAAARRRHLHRHPVRRRPRPQPAALARPRRRADQPHRGHRRDAAPVRRRVNGGGLRWPCTG